MLLKELKKQVDENGNRRAISALGQEISYSELDAKSTILADYLLNVLQLSKSEIYNAPRNLDKKNDENKLG